MGLIGSEPPDGLTDDDLTDLDRERLNAATDGDPGRSPDDRLADDDFTDLDADLLGLDRVDALRDRYAPRELAVIVGVHALPAAIALAATVAPVDAARLVRGVGLDLLVWTGLLAFASGVAAHATRTVRGIALVDVTSAGIGVGAAASLLALAGATLTPATFATPAPLSSLATPHYAQAAAMAVTTSLFGGLLLVTRIGVERA